MKQLDFIKNVDIYLLDQCTKGRITSSTKALDAGFGRGRNFRFLLNQRIDVVELIQIVNMLNYYKMNFQKKEVVSFILQ